MHDRNRSADESVRPRSACAHAAAVIRTWQSAWPRRDLGHVGADRIDDLDTDLSARRSMLIADSPQNDGLAVGVHADAGDKSDRPPPSEWSGRRVISVDEIAVRERHGSPPSSLSIRRSRCTHVASAKRS